MIFGSGIIRGMFVTLKNFATSYFRKPDEGGLFTVEYPEKRIPLKERFRSFPFLVYDGTPENLRCTACDICARECPPKCIYVVRAADQDGRPLRRPAAFTIDYSVCMNCGMCEEVCPFDSIFMDHEFEIASQDRYRELVYTLTKLLKSNEYFNNIRPRDAQAVDKKRREAEEKKKLAAAQAAKPKLDEPPKPV
ncbi:MAG: NADH-quinone oxidoreductase subunit I [Candidatus Omnitrophica bacterium]|nr:NADH-quinone oxidoreductase subunit I [Candidatus Omnitrophota bacterium]